MQKKRKVLYVILAVYIVVLLRIVFYRFFYYGISALYNGELKLTDGINLIPFVNMFSSYSNVSSTVGYFNLFGNVAIFIPLGIFLQLFRKNKRIAPCLVWVFVATLAIELLQLLTGLGIFDVDDLILNFSGGVIGILVYRLLLRLVHDGKHKSDFG